MNPHNRLPATNVRIVTEMRKDRPRLIERSRSNANDAVIIVPGFGGSELVDIETGTIMWGLANPSWYVRAWGSGAALEVLKVTDAEREGRLRLKASRLLRGPAFIPGLRGLESYSRLVRTAQVATAHPDAVLVFPYDWRLGVAQNAGLLATAAEVHLARWRNHQHGSYEAKLIVIAHSSGGLVAERFATVTECNEMLRTIIAVGVPFHGTVAVIQMLSGQGSPVILSKKASKLFRTMPGIYDMLPTYRCVDQGDSVRMLTVADVASLGGDIDLASQALQSRQNLLGISDGRELTTIAGVGQPTAQSILLRDGEIETTNYFCDVDSDGSLRRVDLKGDGIVFPDTATIYGANIVYVPQTHGALPGCAEVLTIVQQTISSRPVNYI